MAPLKRPLPAIPLTPADLDELERLLTAYHEAKARQPGSSIAPPERWTATTAVMRHAPALLAAARERDSLATDRDAAVAEVVRLYGQVETLRGALASAIADMVHCGVAVEPTLDEALEATKEKP